MQGGFVKGMIVGGMVAGAVGAMMSTDMGGNRTKRKMKRYGNSFLRKSSIIVDDIADLFR